MVGEYRHIILEKNICWIDGCQLSRGNLSLGSTSEWKHRTKWPPFKWMSIFKSNPNHVKGRKLVCHELILVQMA